MSENIISINSPNQTFPPSTKGLTTKVVKGSLWTLAGTVFPFAVTFFATPFIIRLLGSEGYGVLILVSLIPSYFGFADFGMGVASTKFGAEAYAQGLRQKEGEVVRTASLIALISSIAVALPIFLFSSIISDWLKVPENWQTQANLGLKITTITFVIGILAGILNTPQLSRLRMDLNMLVNALPRIILSIATLIVLYFGGGVIGAVYVTFFVSILILSGHIFFSGRLLPELYQLTIDKVLIKPLLKFGSGLLIASIAAILLVNLEKIFLTRLVSVKSLAYYSVAFTFANMATMFSSSMIQSLIPAFSQLLTPEKKNQFDSLFSRSIRLNLIWLFPAIMFLLVIAKPFFTIWAGEEFGKESSLPFYILLLGLFFNILAYIPHSSITASGRTDIFAKIYWIELIIYTIAIILLVSSFQVIGAAIAWSLRVIIDALIIIWLARRITGTSFKFFNHFSSLLGGLLLLLPPVIFAMFYDNFSFWLIILVPISIIFYSLLIWKTFIESDEKFWIKNKIGSLLGLKQ